MEKNMISVIVPVYNGEATIERCITSILNASTYAESIVEVIVINDGSTDSTKNICEKYAEKIILINSNNQGVSSARNTGLETAKGEYIFFVDADDTVDKNIFTTFEAVSKETQWDLLNFGYCIVKNDKCMRVKGLDRDYAAENQNQIDEIIHNLSRAYIWNKVFRKDIIEKHNIRFDKNISYGEDTIFLCNYLKHICSLYISKEFLYYYTENAEGNSLSKKKYDNKLTQSFVELVKAQNCITERFPNYGKEYIDGQSRKVLVMKTILNIYQCKSTYKQRKSEFDIIKSNCGLNNLKCESYFGVTWRVIGELFGKIPFALYDLIVRVMIKIR